MKNRIFPVMMAFLLIGGLRQSSTDLSKNRR